MFSYVQQQLMGNAAAGRTEVRNTYLGTYGEGDLRYFAEKAYAEEKIYRLVNVGVNDKRNFSGS